MSEAPRRQSHVMAWTLSIVGSLLIYVLSIGPMVAIEIRRPFSPPVTHFFIGFYAPVRWLNDHTPLQGPMRAYVQWWVDFLRRL